MIGRNDFCWCGSGKKFKKCHIERPLPAGDPRKDYLEKHGIILKTKEMITGLRKIGKISGNILKEVCSRVTPGISTETINGWVHQLTLEAGAHPSPLNYRGFPKSVCTSVNEVVCHGIPSETTILKNGDIINIDVTCDKDGFFGDTSRTVYVGNPNPEGRKVTETAQKCLELGISVVKPGAPLSDIGKIIEKHAREQGCSVVRDFVGHGIGGNFHEDPQIFHYANNYHLAMVENMVFTIEPMINAGDYRTKVLKDNWTAVTLDKRMSAQFEHTLLVTSEGVEILTLPD